VGEGWDGGWQRRARRALEASSARRRLSRSFGRKADRRPTRRPGGSRTSFFALAQKQSAVGTAWHSRAGPQHQSGAVGRRTIPFLLTDVGRAESRATAVSRRDASPHVCFFSSSIARKASWLFFPGSAAAAAVVEEPSPPAAVVALTKVVPAAAAGTGAPKPTGGRRLSDAPRPSRLAFDFGLGAGRRSVAGVRCVGGPSPPPTVPDEPAAGAALAPAPLEGKRWVPASSGRRTPSNSKGL
jgi:hypothetical protein